MKKADIVSRDDRFLVTGDLDFCNIMLVYQKTLSLLDQHKQLVFDFSQLKSSNSAGLALMVEWVKLAREQKKSVRFLNLSHDIMAIARAAGLEALFNGNT